MLEAEQYRYQAALSDMSNSDIAAHGNDPVQAAREGAQLVEERSRAPGPALIWDRFNEFMAYNYRQLKADGHSDRDIERLPVAELIDRMQSWVETNRPS